MGSLAASARPGSRYCFVATDEAKQRQLTCTDRTLNGTYHAAAQLFRIEDGRPTLRSNV